MSASEAAALALETLGRLGLDGEAYAEDGVRVRVAVSEGKVESVEERRDRGIGVRAFRDGTVGFAYTTDLSAGSIREAAALAAELARHGGRDEAWRLPRPGAADPLPFPNEDPEAEAAPISRRIDTARAIESAALAFDPRVRATRRSIVTDYRGEVLLASSAGAAAGYRAGRALAWVDAIASENGSSQTGQHVAHALGPAGIDPDAVGREAAARAVGKLGSVPGRTGLFPVVLDRDVVSGLLDELAPAFSARRVLKGTSPLAGRQGSLVASPRVTLVDDPRLPGGYGSCPVDGEGFPTRRTVLIEEGRLAGLLHDAYSAAKTGAGTPGNTVRESCAAPPKISPMNLLLEPGELDAPALVERAGEGLWIAEVMGLHTADPISGDFSLGGSGRLIEGGRLGAPVDRIAFAGNLLELLASVEAVGSDLRLFPDGGGAPSLLLRELSVAGGA